MSCLGNVNESRIANAKVKIDDSRLIPCQIQAQAELSYFCCHKFVMPPW